jgi:hypothetical protein
MTGGPFSSSSNGHSTAEEKLAGDDTSIET